MINCLCVIQSGQAAHGLRSELASALDSYEQEHLGDSLQVNWVPVAEGSGFTAGKRSTSSVISLAANEALSQEKREFLLRELVDLWTAKTGCEVDEVVAVVADPAVH